MTGVTPIRDLLRTIIGDDDLRGEVEAALMTRDEQIAEYIRTAGNNFGAEPAFVAKVILDIGIGRVMAPEEQHYINQVFAERLAYYQQMHQQPPEGGEGEV
jgi:hypothetical protein